MAVRGGCGVPLLVLLFICIITVNGASISVTVDWLAGNDTSCTTTIPCLTIQRALAISNSNAGPVTIYVNSGTYLQSSTLFLGSSSNSQLQIVGASASAPPEIICRGGGPINGITITQTLAIGTLLANLTISNCQAGVHLDNANRITLQSVTSRLNVIGFRLLKSTAINMQSCVAANNTNTGYGGGMYFDQSNGTIEDCLVANNSANAGAGVYMTQSNPTIYTTQIYANTATTFGTAIYMLTSSPLLDTLTIYDHRGSGAIYMQNSSPLISSCTVYNNQGVIYSTGATPVIKDSSFTNSALRFLGGSLRLEGCTVSNTSSSARALELSNLVDGGAQIIGCDISYNSGGGISVYGSTITIQDSSIQWNKASGDGGGIASDSSILTITNTTIKSNTALSGAGVSSIRGKLTVSAIVEKNVATSLGGGILAFNSNYTIKCTVTSNQASTGAGIYLLGGSGSVSESQITNNRATNLGNGIFLYDTYADIASSIFSDNRATTITQITRRNSTLDTVIHDDSFIDGYPIQDYCCFGLIYPNGWNISVCNFGCSPSSCYAAFTCTCDSSALTLPHGSFFDPASCDCTQSVALGSQSCAASSIGLSSSGATTKASTTGTSMLSTTYSPTMEPPKPPTEPPTDAPTEPPTEEPTEAPTDAPTEPPTDAPTEAPTESPTDSPTTIPTTPPTTSPTPTTTSSTPTTTHASTSGPLPVCGNNVVESGEECDSATDCCNECKLVKRGTPCRSSRGPCDIADTCDGVNPICLDAVQAPTFVCGVSSGVCDFAAVCGISNSSCPPNVQKAIDACGLCGGDNSSCSTEGKCGDGICYEPIGENCTTCFIDCGACKPVTCEQHCNSPNGICVNGLCLCNSPWSGTYCNQSNSAVLPSPNAANPVVTISPSNPKQTTVNFTIGVREIREVTHTGEVKTSFDLTRDVISVTANVTNSSKSWVYTHTLPNKADIVFSFLMVNSATNIDFANKSFTLVPNTVKVTMFVNNWPFALLANSLELVMKVNVPQSGFCSAPQVSTNTDTAGNLRSLEYTVDGQTFVSKYLDFALVDGASRPLRVSLSSTRDVVFSLSHFWSYASIDPDFSVIVNQAGSKDGCGSERQFGTKSKTLSTVGIALIVACVTGAIIAMAVGYTVRKIRRGKAKRRLRSFSHMEPAATTGSVPPGSSSPKMVVRA